MRVSTALLVALVTLGTASAAVPLIRGGEGNTPLDDPGWPRGGAGLFNHEGRIAWWEGPPFGGGQWHSECRGDAKSLNKVLADFAKLDSVTRRVVVHDGSGQSFWLNMNNEPEKKNAARVDWTFTVWQPASWDRLRAMPADLNPLDPKDTTPPAQIDIYTSRIRWKDVAVPEGLEVIDNRLEAHGFTPADGVVYEGSATDLATQKPLAATIRLETVEPQPKGGYAHTLRAEAKTDAQGRWVLKNVQPGWVRLVLSADGFAPRILGYDRIDDQPRWKRFEGGLARSVAIAGRVTDEAGTPLGGVEVSLGNVEPSTGGRYEPPSPYEAATAADGRFRLDGVPAGKADVWVRKSGYIRPGLGEPIATPKDDVALKMIKSAGVKVTIDFGGKARPEGYVVQMSPEGGDVIGSYGGSGQINDKNQMSYENVPPGRYVLRARPNPSSGNDEAGPFTVDLVGGKIAEITIQAK